MLNKMSLKNYLSMLKLLSNHLDKVRLLNDIMKSIDLYRKWRKVDEKEDVKENQVIDSKLEKNEVID